MEIRVYKKEYFKESCEVQNAIKYAVEELCERIENYEKQHIPFSKIFNDDRVKYDKNGDFYTFKYQKLNLQLRILYAYIIVEGTPVIIIADFVLKKKNNKKYIKRFENAKNWDPYLMYKNSQSI